MNGFQNIKRLLIPLLKGLPIVVGCFLLALFIARLVISYTPNTYQTIARIELDDEKFGFSNNNLYGDFDVFATENKVETEAEILKSPLLISRALDSVNLEVLIYRKGSIKNAMLYDDAPFRISHQFENRWLLDHLIDLSVMDENTFTLTYHVYETPYMLTGTFGTPVMLEGEQLLVEKNEALIAARNLQLVGDYQFKVFSRKGLIADIASRLDVKAVDKEISILRVVFKDEHPAKVADFVNALCRAYIEDYIMTKSSAANQTVNFIDEELNQIGQQLNAAENELERFKKANGVVNTLQETETGLRQLSNLQVQLVNMEMNEQAIIQLQSYIENGTYFDETAINFGFGDLLMTELVKKMKLWQDERHDLLIKYTPDNEKIKAVDAKIEEVKVYIKEAIKQNLHEIEVKRADVEAAVELASHQFDDLPTREKKQHILERDFRLLEDVYNFLSQKRIEASIASSASIAFHRVIQPAVVPKMPVSPNGTLTTFVFGLLGLIIGIAIIFLRRFALAKITSREDMERLSELPIAGIIRDANKCRDFDLLFKSLLIKSVIVPGQTIAICSTLKGEGKSYIAQHLSEAIANLGYTATTHSVGCFSTGEGDHELSEKLAAQKQNFDFTLVDTPATAADIAGVEAMKLADLTLYVVRSNFTGQNYMVQPDLLREEFELNNIQLVLNAAHKATNYSGNYVGSQFRCKDRPKWIMPRLKYIFKTYIGR